jgi:hypothetical protein
MLGIMRYPCVLTPLFVCSVSVVTNDASPGKHVLTCEVMKETTDPGGGHEFRLIAVDVS